MKNNNSPKWWSNCIIFFFKSQILYQILKTEEINESGFIYFDEYVKEVSTFHFLKNYEQHRKAILRFWTWDNQNTMYDFNIHYIKLYEILIIYLLCTQKEKTKNMYEIKVKKINKNLHIQSLKRQTTCSFIR